MCPAVGCDKVVLVTISGNPQEIHIGDLKRMVEITFETLEQQRIANNKHTPAD